MIFYSNKNLHLISTNKHPILEKPYKIFLEKEEKQ